MTDQLIESERFERMRMWAGRYAEPLDVVPVPIVAVAPGSICRLWFMPNQMRFVVLGADGMGSVKTCTMLKSVSAFTRDALVVVVYGPPAKFPNLLNRIRKFEADITEKAWCGRLA